MSPLPVIQATSPELQVAHWLNVEPGVQSEPQLASLRGRVVLLETFQLLCPGCVSHGLPLAQQVHDLFPRAQVSVVGLHTVFEHHAAQDNRDVLAAFLHENRITFPVGMDMPAVRGSVPLTMQSYALQGTPSLLLFDQQGRLRLRHLGQMSALTLGAYIMSLVMDSAEQPAAADNDGVAGRDGSACVLPTDTHVP